MRPHSNNVISKVLAPPVGVRLVEGMAHANHEFPLDGEYQSSLLFIAQQRDFKPAARFCVAGLFQTQFVNEAIHA
jgi:hypothetical protein